MLIVRPAAVTVMVPNSLGPAELIAAEEGARYQQARKRAAEAVLREKIEATLAERLRLKAKEAGVLSSGEMMTYDVIKTWNIPTQNCLLAHVTTQMKCMESGSHVGLVFQSIAGSQKGNDSFGISVGLLDEAYELAKKHCFPKGPNFMYFETGQGSALSADAHNGWDQLTLEARNYGLAKRWHPYQVNTVVGFQAMIR